MTHVVPAALVTVAAWSLLASVHRPVTDPADAETERAIDIAARVIGTICLVLAVAWLA